MEFDSLPELLRGFERLSAVFIGGFTIYLGYRLFSLAPTDKNAAGTVTLPGGIKVNLSRVGPGAFFALFGGILIGIALLSPIRKEVKITHVDGSSWLYGTINSYEPDGDIISVDGEVIKLP